jgi:hypothetical protein
MALKDNGDILPPPFYFWRVISDSRQFISATYPRKDTDLAALVQERALLKTPNGISYITLWFAVDLFIWCSSSK